MPKLLQINITANWGSTGKIAEQIGLCAMAHGWESFVAWKLEQSFSVVSYQGGQQVGYVHALWRAKNS